MPHAPRFGRALEAVERGGFGRAPVGPVPPSELLRLHIGDSADTPGDEMRLTGELTGINPHWHQYPAPAGTGQMRRTVAGFYSSMHATPTVDRQILVSAGATSALHALVTLLCDPGDTVLVPTPVWPLFPGIVRLAGARVRELPLHHRLDALDPSELETCVESAIDPTTTMLYLNTPNNPSGTLMSPAQRATLLRVARRHKLWVISDEAYDGMAFDGLETPSAASDPEAGDELVVVSTLSKIHRAAGLRIGWVRASEELIAAATRIATFQIYSASAAAQALAAPTLSTRAEWAPRVRERLQDSRNRFIEATGLDIAPPSATYFAFLDLQRWLGPGTDAGHCAAALLREGVGTTPGREFGEDFTGWLRVCFASENEARTVEAARRIGEWIREHASPGTP